MSDESFQKLDESLMKEFKGLREKNAPSEIRKNFSAEVERRILEGQNQRASRPIWSRFWLPIFVPALGALVIFISTTVLRQPVGSRAPFPSTSSLPLALSVASEISDEIQALEELGVWTEEDDSAVDESLVDF